MSREAVTISFRLGGDDGVAVEARKWSHALTELGFTMRRVAGAIEDDGERGDLVIPGLAIESAEPIDERTISTALDGADLVIVDNICSLPLNIDAARAIAKVAADHPGRIVFRHHDLPWQRRALSDLESEFPPRVTGALHATINLRSRRELEARAYEGATTIHNYFDLNPAAGDRAGTRQRHGFAHDAYVVLQPARAIPRKNVPGGLLFAQRLQTLMPDLNLQYWLSGPAEDGYQETLARVLERTPVPVTIGRAQTANDAYAACDLVAFPSTWEGFGNPVVESIAARRVCAAGTYPVLAELRSTGIRVFSTERPEALVHFLAQPADVRDQFLDVNVHRAAISYDIAALPAAIDDAFASHGWLSW
jgi:glycosyltransferase involved in cell wall biosynthesis